MNLLLQRRLCRIAAFPLLVSALTLVSCSAALTKGELDHGSSVVVSQNYAVASKGIVRAMQACHPQYVTTMRIVPELKSVYISAQASGNDSKGKQAALRIDVYEATPNQANVNVYSGDRNMSESVEAALIKGWLNDGSRSCRINGRPEGGPASF